MHDGELISVGSRHVLELVFELDDLSCDRGDRRPLRLLVGRRRVIAADRLAYLVLSPEPRRHLPLDVERDGFCLHRPHEDVGVATLLKRILLPEAVFLQGAGRQRRLFAWRGFPVLELFLFATN